MSGRVMDVLRRLHARSRNLFDRRSLPRPGGFGTRLESARPGAAAAVFQWTGIPVSVGIAPTKTLAKVANHAAKKDEKHARALLLLDEAAQDAALARIGLTDLWGVAGRLAARLTAIGIKTPLDLKRGRSVARSANGSASSRAPGARVARRAVPRSRAGNRRTAKASWPRVPSAGR